MKTSGLKHDVWAKPVGCSNLASLWRKVSGMVMAGLVLLTASFLPQTAPAQTTMTIKPWQIRLEVTNAFVGVVTNVVPLRIPTNGASYLTNYDTLNTDPGSYTNWVIAPVNVSVSGAPSGDTATLVDSGLVNPIGPIVVNLNTNNTASNTNLIVKQVFDGSQPSGVYTLTITASGGGLPDDSFFLPVELASLWNGADNAAANGAGSWSDPTQWAGGVPGPLTNVVFTDVGAQTNVLVNGSDFLTNSLVDSSITIASLRFAMTNAAGNPLTNYHNIYINDGQNLAIAGDDGFSMLRDETYWNARPMNITIRGTNATFIQTNENSTFSILSDAQQNSLLNMSGLGNLYLDINRFYLADYLGYPNYRNLESTNNYGINSTTLGAGSPKRFYMTWDLAKTNYIKCTYVDPDNYTNSLTRTYALTLGHNQSTGGSSGQDAEMWLGYSNVFNLDSICVAGFSCLGADMRFLNTGSYAKFRNADGVSRMSIFATADAGGGGTILDGTTLGDNTKCGGNGPGVDFTRGSVDMLVDRLYLSMDRSNVTANGKGVSQTAFWIGSNSVIDANTVIIAYKSQGNQTNASNCNATMTVTNTGVLKVNNTLALGYETATPGDVSVPSSTKGVLNIGPGGTVMANNITVGGITKASAGNNINMTAGASLIVSNGIADSSPNGALGTLNMSGNNDSLTLFIDGSNPNPVVYLTNFTASGTGNRLIIGGVKNLTYPADVLLIKGANSTIPINSSAFDAGITMPAGLGLSASFNPMANNTISIHIINRQPNFTVWRGANTGGGNGNWDYTTTNWMVLSGPNAGMLTNYENPDVVAFDDTPGVATNVVITGASTLTPGGINMTNDSLYYTFGSGGNSLNATLNKYGTNTLEVDATSSLSAQINQGKLTGAGTIGSAAIAGGAAMYYLGNMSGSLNSAGVATIAGGTVSGTVTAQGGGIVTNTGTVNNPVAVQSGGLLYNSGTIVNPGVGSSGAPQVASGGTLINKNILDDGTTPGDVFYVNGTFKDLGGTANMTITALAIGAGGTYIPGGDGIGTSVINSDGYGSPVLGASAAYPGWVALFAGSTTMLKVSPGSTPLNTVVSCAYLSFGGSSGTRNQNGATLSIANIGGPYAAGQSFRFFDNVFTPGTVPFNTGSSTNTFPVIVPQTPGPGLAWDLSHLWDDGSIRVIAQPQITLTNSFAIQGGTNVVIQFSWDAANQGDVLEQQVNPLSVGLSTNWTRYNGSITNTSWTITNSMDSGNVYYYRLAYP